MVFRYCYAAQAETVFGEYLGILPDSGMFYVPLVAVRIDALRPESVMSAVGASVP